MMNKIKNMFWSDKTENAPDEDSQVPSDVVTVYRGTQNPTLCWRELKVKQTHFKKDLLRNDTPIYEDKVRFVCMSDTHNRTKRMFPEFVPPGDVFLHAGDFSMTGKMEEIEEFNGFLGTLPHRHKIVIAGNHDMTFDDEFLIPSKGLGNQFNLKVKEVKAYLKDKGIEKVSQLLTNCTYVQDAEIKVAGVRIYGSPWQPEFGQWGFNLTRGKELLDKWNKIPKGIDILMTHGPPVGHGDYTFDGIRAGCVELLNTIQKRVRPSYHIFGHIHEGYGVTSDGYTTYINASTCNLRYNPLNPPIIFDIPLKPGYTKDDIKFVTCNAIHSNEASSSLAEQNCNQDKGENEEEYVFFEHNEEQCNEGWDSDECTQDLDDDADSTTDTVKGQVKADDHVF